MSEHFWKLRCRKSARHSEAHIEVKMHKTPQCRTTFAMSKKCTPLWREAHFEVKIYKAPQCRTTFGSCDVEKVHAVVARSTFRSQNVKKKLGVRTTFGGSDVASLRFSTLHCITLHSTTLHYTPLHHTTLHNTTTTTTQLHSTILRYTPLH